MDLAFSNAPLPLEVEKAECARASLAHLLSAEVSKNTNQTPTAACSSGSSVATSVLGLGRRGSVSSTPGPNFSSGLHLSNGTRVGGFGLSANGTRSARSGSQGSAVCITSPSALSQGLSPQQQQQQRNNSFSVSSSSSSSSSPPVAPLSPTPTLTTSLLDSESESIDYLICSAFFRVFVSMLKDYRSFLIFPTASQPFPDPCFDLPGFLKTQESKGLGGTGLKEFMNDFTKTQAFRRFCEERTFPNHKDNKRVLFFDESILAKVHIRTQSNSARGWRSCIEVFDLLTLLVCMCCLFFIACLSSR